MMFRWWLCPSGANLYALTYKETKFCAKPQIILQFLDIKSRILAIFLLFAGDKGR